jgi:hypothetical protein
MRTRSRDNDPQRKAPDDDLMPTALPSIRKPSAGDHVRRTGAVYPIRMHGSPEPPDLRKGQSAWRHCAGRYRLAEWDLFSITLGVRGDIEWIQKKAILSIVPAAPGESKSANRRGRGHAV